MKVVVSPEIGAVCPKLLVLALKLPLSTPRIVNLFGKR